MQRTDKERLTGESARHQLISSHGRVVGNVDVTVVALKHSHGIAGILVDIPVCHEEFTVARAVGKLVAGLVEERTRSLRLDAVTDLCLAVVVIRAEKIEYTGVAAT